MHSNELVRTAFNSIFFNGSFIYYIHRFKLFIVSYITKNVYKSFKKRKNDVKRKKKDLSKDKYS